MSSVVTIPLDKNPEVADLLTDMQPGDRVYACFTIKSKDDQTANLRISEMARTKDELPDASEYDEDAEDMDHDEPNDDEDGDGSDEEERDSARDIASSY